VRRLPPASRSRILDFDLETVAAGFADPDWVPQKITCVAWSWIGEDEVHSRISTSEGLFRRPERRRKMLAALLEQIAQADVLTGHNIIRFDLPIVNAEAMRLGLEPVRGALVQDTMRLIKSKGFKKGQDNLGELTGVPIEKMALTWQGWQHAYEEKGWAGVIERCESDVLAHKILREKLIERRWLKPARMWSP
jgi:DNA polymerase elongation subunit (family B)